MTDYKKIDWADVRAGDVLMHGNGDRMTVRAVEYAMELPPVVVTLNVRLYPEAWASFGFTPHRKVEPVPTEPGAYLDKDGVLCVLMPRFTDDFYSWMIARERRMPYWTTAMNGDIVGRAPFTRLVPMPTEENVHSSIFKGFSGSQVSGVYIERATAAVMSLLGGGDDD